MKHYTRIAAGIVIGGSVVLIVSYSIVGVCTLILLKCVGSLEYALPATLISDLTAVWMSVTVAGLVCSWLRIPSVWWIVGIGLSSIWIFLQGPLFQADMPVASMIGAYLLAVGSGVLTVNQFSRISAIKSRLAVMLGLFVAAALMISCIYYPILRQEYSWIDYLSMRIQQLGVALDEARKHVK